MRLYRYAKLIYKTLEYYWPEYVPWTPPKPERWEFYPGWIDRYDCPTNLPYTEGTGFHGFSASYTTIPNSHKCTKLQVPLGIKDTHNEFIIGPLMQGGSRFQYDLVVLYPRSMPRPIPKPVFLPARKPLFLPAEEVPLPGIFPEALPIQKPVTASLAVPYPLLPLRPDSPWPQGRKTSNGDPQTRAPRPRLTDDPLVGPAVQTDGGPMYSAPPHAFVAPRRGDKERKPDPGRAANAVKGFIDGALGSLTEGADLVGAIHDALPKKAQCRNCTPQGQLKAIYDNFDKLDIPQAIINVALNQA